MTKQIDLSFTLEEAEDLYEDLLKNAVLVDSISNLLLQLKAAISIEEAK